MRVSQSRSIAMTITVAAFAMVVVGASDLQTITTDSPRSVLAKDIRQDGDSASYCLNPKDSKGAPCDESHTADKEDDGGSSLRRKAGTAAVSLGTDKQDKMGVSHLAAKKRRRNNKKTKKGKKHKRKSENDRATVFSLPTPSEKLPFGLWWFGPFFSGGGYSSEAIAFADALVPRIKLRITHHGGEFWCV